MSETGHCLFVRAVIYTGCASERLFSKASKALQLMTLGNRHPFAATLVRRKLKCLRPNWQGCHYPCLHKRATFDWPAWTTAYVQIQLCFRSEFRPLGSLSLSFFTCLTLVQRKLCPHWSLGSLVVVRVGPLFFFWGWLWCLFPVFSFLSPYQYAEFPSFT